MTYFSTIVAIPLHRIKIKDIMKKLILPGICLTILSFVFASWDYQVSLRYQKMANRLDSIYSNPQENMELFLETSVGLFYTLKNIQPDLCAIAVNPGFKEKYLMRFTKEKLEAPKRWLAVPGQNCDKEGSGILVVGTANYAPVPEGETYLDYFNGQDNQNRFNTVR